MNIKNKINSKGQVLSYDMLVAGLLFILVFGIAMNFYYGIENDKQDQEFLNATFLKANNTFNTIITDTNCLSGGIVNSYGEVSNSKMACFSGVNYDIMREELEIENYDFVLRIYDSSTTDLNTGTIGSKRAISIQRILFLDGQVKNGVFVLYEK